MPHTDESLDIDLKTAVDYAESLLGMVNAAVGGDADLPDDASSIAWDIHNYLLRLARAVGVEVAGETDDAGADGA